MPLDERQVTTLLSSVLATQEHELHCDECLAGMAEFAERQLVGAELPEALRRIDAHIQQCPECAEEYEVLRAAVRESADADLPRP